MLTWVFSIQPQSLRGTSPCVTALGTALEQLLRSSPAVASAGPATTSLSHAPAAAFQSAVQHSAQPAHVHFDDDHHRTSVEFVSVRSTDAESFVVNSDDELFLYMEMTSLLPIMVIVPPMLGTRFIIRPGIIPSTIYYTDRNHLSLQSCVDAPLSHAQAPRHSDRCTNRALPSRPDAATVRAVQRQIAEMRATFTPHQL